MKPHSSTHHTLPSHGTAGIDLSALGAGKDPTATDAASPGFASIMALQLANSADTAANPVDAKVLNEENTSESDRSVDKLPVAAELILPMSVDLLGFHAAQSQMMATHLKTPPKEAGVNHIEAKMTEAGTPLVVDKSANRLALPTDMAVQVPPELLGFQPQQSTVADAGGMTVSEPILPTIKGMQFETQRQGTQPAKPVMRALSDDATQMMSVAALGVEKDEQVATMPQFSGNAKTTSEQEFPAIQQPIEERPTRSADAIPLKPEKFALPTLTTETVRNEVRGVNKQLVATQSTVEKQTSKTPEVSMALIPQTQLGLTLASMLVQAPERPASTIETFGMRVRLPQAPKSGMQQPTFDAVANQTMKSQSAIPLALASAISQSTESTPSTLIADKLVSVPVTSKEVVSDVKPSMDRPSDAPPAWLQPGMLTPMAPAVAVAHDTAVMHQRVGTAAFADEFIGQVNLWVKKASDTGAMTAELHLNPVEMGPVQIRIEIDGSNAQVSFVAQHLETRQAIEASMGALSNTLQEAGIQLSGSGVSDQSPQQQASSGFGTRGDDAPRPWQSPQQTATGDTLLDSKKPFLDETAPWERPRAGQNASGLDLYA